MSRLIHSAIVANPYVFLDASYSFPSLCHSSLPNRFATLLGYNVSELEKNFHCSRFVPDRFSDRIVAFCKTLQKIQESK